MSLNSTSSDRVLLVFGVGSGIGSAVASLLVIKHFHKVALIARSEKNLQESKDTIEAAARSHNIDVEIKTWAADITDLKTLKPILSEVEKFGELECVFYNAARVRPSPLFEETNEEIRYDFEVSNKPFPQVTRKLTIFRSQTLLSMPWHSGQFLFSDLSLLARLGRRLRCWSPIASCTSIRYQTSSRYP